jgi:hypothetical protein
MKKSALQIALHSALFGFCITQLFTTNEVSVRWVMAIYSVATLLFIIANYANIAMLERHEIHVLDTANELKFIVSLEMAEAYYAQSDNFEQAKECRDQSDEYRQGKPQRSRNPHAFRPGRSQAIASLKAHHITEDGQKVTQ